MSTEEGTIVRTEGTKAWVMVRRGSMCDTCKSKKSCHSLSDNVNMESEAMNIAGAKTGDRVVIKIASGALFKISFVFYMIPVLALMAGAILGKNYAEGLNSETELYSVLFALAGSIISFLVIKVIAQWMDNKKKYTPEIVRVLSSPKKSL